MVWTCVVSILQNNLTGPLFFSSTGAFPLSLTMLCWCVFISSTIQSHATGCLWWATSGMGKTTPSPPVCYLHRCLEGDHPIPQKECVSTLKSCLYRKPERMRFLKVSLCSVLCSFVASNFAVVANLISLSLFVLWGVLLYLFIIQWFGLTHEILLYALFVLTGCKSMCRVIIPLIFFPAV